MWLRCRLTSGQLWLHYRETLIGWRQNFDARLSAPSLSDWPEFGCDRTASERCNGCSCSLRRSESHPCKLFSATDAWTDQFQWLAGYTEDVPARCRSSTEATRGIRENKCTMDRHRWFQNLPALKNQNKTKFMKLNFEKIKVGKVYNNDETVKKWKLKIKIKK